MSRLETYQRLADREAARLGVERKLTVAWSCKPLRRFERAHAHIRGMEMGRICVRRGLTDWRITIKHEVAHFAPGGQRHGLGFLRIRAGQGDPSAKAQLVRMGKRRCPRHQWERRREISRKATSKGLSITYAAYCWRCGKEIGA